MFISNCWLKSLQFPFLLAVIIAAGAVVATSTVDPSFHSSISQVNGLPLWLDIGREESLKAANDCKAFPSLYWCCGRDIVRVEGLKAVEKAELFPCYAFLRLLFCFLLILFLWPIQPFMVLSSQHFLPFLYFFFQSLPPSLLYSCLLLLSSLPPLPFLLFLPAPPCFLLPSPLPLVLP